MKLLSFSPFDSSCRRLFAMATGALVLTGLLLIMPFLANRVDPALPAPEICVLSNDAPVKRVSRRDLPPGIVFSGDLARIKVGIDMYKCGRIGRLLIVGFDYQPKRIAAMFNLPRGKKAPRIEFNMAAMNTDDSAQDTVQWLRDRGIKSAVIITSDWHMERSLALLRRYGGADIAFIRRDVEAHPDLTTLLAERAKYTATKLGFGGIRRYQIRSM